MAGGAPGRADRHRDQGHPRRDSDPARPGPVPPLRGELRPPEHPVPHRAQERPEAAAAATAAHRARRGRRHRVLPDAVLGRAGCRVPRAERDRGAALSRRARRPHARFVAHLDLPKSVEGYYQETGRAGRDGFPSTAWLSYGLADVVQQRKLIDASAGDDAHRRRQSLHLDAMLALCETVSCRRVQLLGYFGEASEPCGNCDTCAAPPQAWDGTIAAQKLLSAVYRLRSERHQKFGAGHVIDILLGKNTPKITQHRHDTLTVFGIGTELRDTEWRGVVRQLLAQGLLSVEGDYGTLVLTDASAQVLRKQRPVMLRREPERPAKPPKAAKATKAAKAEAAAMPPEAAPVFDELRAWRAAAAKEQSVPAYVIFHDSTLREIATKLPATLAELSTISGVGETKLARYGRQILDTLESAARPPG